MRDKNRKCPPSNRKLFGGGREGMGWELQMMQNDVDFAHSSKGGITKYFCIPKFDLRYFCSDSRCIIGLTLST